MAAEVTCPRGATQFALVGNELLEGTADSLRTERNVLARRLADAQAVRSRQGLPLLAVDLDDQGRSPARRERSRSRDRQ